MDAGGDGDVIIYVFIYLFVCQSLHKLIKIEVRQVENGSNKKRHRKSSTYI